MFSVSEICLGHVLDASLPLFSQQQLNFDISPVLENPNTADFNNIDTRYYYIQLYTDIYSVTRYINGQLNNHTLMWWLGGWLGLLVWKGVESNLILDDMEFFPFMEIKYGHWWLSSIHRNWAGVKFTSQHKIGIYQMALHNFTCFIIYEKVI